MSILKNFRAFILRGNVVDLAVGVIIGAAFGKIVSSLVSDILTPAIGVTLGGVDFRDLKWIIQNAITGPDGKVTQPEVTLNIGVFLQTIIDFLIIGGAVFALIQGLGALQRRAASKATEATETKPAIPEPTPTERLLTEIRDTLRQNSAR